MRKFIDQYDMYDCDGNLIQSKGMPEHMKVWFDEYSKDNTGNMKYPYTVVSLSTVYRLKVTEETTAGEWREFSYNCEMAR